MKHQPLQMIDCQRELLGLVPNQEQRIARLKAQRLAAWAVAMAGWITVAAILVIQK